MMSVSVERTSEAIVLKLPLNTGVSDIQNILNYFEFVELVGQSRASQEQIEELSREVKSSWWDKNKSRFDKVNNE